MHYDEDTRPKDEERSPKRSPGGVISLIVFVVAIVSAAFMMFGRTKYPDPVPIVVPTSHKVSTWTDLHFN